MEKPDLIPPVCSGCGQPARLAPTPFRVTRGERTLAVETWSWECTSGCADPFTGEHPYRFADPKLMRLSDENARRAWEAKFGEPMPPPRRVVPL